MRISISGKNLEISDYLTDLVEKKVGKLERYFPQDTEVQVTLSVERNRHIVEVTIPYDGGVIRGEEKDGPKIVRVKRFAIKPMSEEEAMLQIEMIGHSFYVFINSETNVMNVLYKRKDGNYGLIEPEQ